MTDIPPEIQEMLNSIDMQEILESISRPAPHAFQPTSSTQLMGQKCGRCFRPSAAPVHDVMIDQQKEKK